MFTGEEMTYEKAALILDGMYEAGLISSPTRFDIRRIMVEYGNARATDATNSAIAIFNSMYQESKQETIEPHSNS
jgi:hypothetical protein